MSTTTRTLAEAAAARAKGVQQRSHRPQARRFTLEDDVPASRGAVRATLRPFTERKLVDRGGVQCAAVGGLATVYEAPYQMYDFWGPYIEVVSRGAGSESLAAEPLVEYTNNHGAGGSLPMAHTRNGTLDLVELAEGLDWTAYVDPRRSDVADTLLAMERGDLAEASFKFRIVRGMWSPDYTEYRIDAYDLEGGDVSSVNFGANPAASSGLRSKADASTRAALRRALRSTARGLSARALSPAESSALTTLLLEVAAAEAVLDPIVDALCAADCALDSAQSTLSGLLGLPDLDPEDGMSGGMNEDAAADVLASRDRARALALAELALDRR